MIYISAFVQPNRSRAPEEGVTMTTIDLEELARAFSSFEIRARVSGTCLYIDSYTMGRRNFENYVRDLTEEALSNSNIVRIRTIRRPFCEVTGFQVYDKNQDLILEVSPWEWKENKPFHGTSPGVELWPVVYKATGSKSLADLLDGLIESPDPYQVSRNGDGWKISKG